MEKISVFTIRRPGNVQFDVRLSIIVVMKNVAVLRKKDVERLRGNGG
jgi:hypothetical protein